MLRASAFQMPSEPKQHHYIPETYSKHFSNEKGHITVYDTWDKCRVFSTSPRAVFKEKYLYSQPVHAESRFDNAMERLFSDTIESGWDQTVRLITEKKELSRNEISQFVEFLLSMRCRVPNALRSVMSLLRDTVTNASDMVAEPVPEILVANYNKVTGRNSNSVSMRDILEAGIIRAEVDPHTAILSMPHIVQGMYTIMNRFNAPTFLHNKTGVDFISSDNPVCYFLAGSHLDEIIPYDVKEPDDFELIFPISPQIALCVDSRRKIERQHRDTHSRNTITRINEIVALFADRYIFNRRGNIEDLVLKYSRVGPIPDFERSTVGDGVVYRIGYKFGQPSAFSNDWEYPFRR